MYVRKKSSGCDKSPLLTTATDVLLLLSPQRAYRLASHHVAGCTHTCLCIWWKENSLLSGSFVELRLVSFSVFGWLANYNWRNSLESIQFNQPDSQLVQHATCSFVWWHRSRVHCHNPFFTLDCARDMHCLSSLPLGHTLDNIARHCTVLATSFWTLLVD